MRGNYISPSELLQAQRETGKSYWDLIGQPLTPAVGYNINNPYSESEKSYKQWYNTDAKQTTQQDTKTSNDQVLNELIQKYNNLQASMNKPKEQKEYEYDDLPSFKKGKDKFTSFAQQLGPKIYKEMNKRGVYSDAAYDNVMRQLAMESSYGQSDVALKNHNYGGVGFNGKTYFNYKNDDAFVKDYIRMMKSKYGAALKAKNTTQYAKALKAGGYYQDSLENYTNKLNAMSSMSAAAKRHRLLNPKMYEYQVLLSDMEEPAVSTRVEKPINKEPIVDTPIQTEAPLIQKPEYLESNSLIRKSFQQNMSNMLQGREFQFTLPGFKGGKDGEEKHSQQIATKAKQAPWYSELNEAVLGEVMQQFRNIAHPGNFRDVSYRGDIRGKNGGTAQRTYLLPRSEQEDIFLRDGYIKGNEGDYGLVKKAVNNRNLPVWQTKPDAVSRKTLVPIGNTYGFDSYGYINRDKDLVHAESHPAAFYVDGSTGKLYTKGWDLNDYGGTGGGRSSIYNIFKKAGADILDFIGNPVVVTTGFQEVTNPWGGASSHLSRGATVQDLFDDDYYGASTVGKMLDNTMSKKGLHREQVGGIGGKWLYALPEVTVTGNKHGLHNHKTSRGSARKGNGKK